MSTFVIDIENFCKKVQDNLDKVVKGTINELGDRIIDRTPIKSGKARTNWQSNAAVEPTGVLEADGSAGDGAKERLRIALAAFNMDSMFYFINNAPYIERLENGYSQQAPIGMVKVTLLEFDEILKEQADRVRTL